MRKPDPAGLYCAYLRKSRKDAELERLGQGETLARHAQALQELAARLGITIAQTYRELVSGDTIADRPQMRRLLDAVNAGAWDGVLVMDADRLGRGDSVDQGLILQSFLYSDTLIITPDKIYDPSDESDSEFFEIKLFFARREYAMIKKRMQRGRLAAVMEGSYLGTRAPFGYERWRDPAAKKWTLRPVPQKAELVRAMFAWYARGMEGKPVGCNTIARRLNDMGVTTDLGRRWTPDSVRSLLHNPVYIGMVQWNQRTKQVRIVDGQRVRSRPRSPAPIVVPGLHAPIVERALFDEVQAILNGHAKRPVNADKRTTNPLAGLVVCGCCGMRMVAKNSPGRRGDFLCCRTQDCPTASTYIDVVEGVILDTLGHWLGEFDGQAAAPPREDPDAAARAAALAAQRERLAALEAQSSRLYDLLEQGVYTVAVYRQRRDELDARMQQARDSIAELSAAPRPDPRALLVPQLRTVLAAYSAADPADKNALLHTVVDHVTYHKSQRCWRNDPLTAHLNLEVFPALIDPDT